MELNQRSILEGSTAEIISHTECIPHVFLRFNNSSAVFSHQLNHPKQLPKPANKAHQNYLKYESKSQADRTVTRNEDVSL